MGETKPLVAITCRVPESGLRLLEARYQIKRNPSEQPLPAAELARFVKGAHAILADLRDKIDARILDAAGKQLKIVANYAVGYDNIDLAAALRRKVAVTNTPGVLTEAVAEHVFALLAAVARRIVEADRFVRQGRFQGWEPDLFVGPQLGGKTLGVLGLGRIGTRVARLGALGYRMKIIYYDRGQKSRQLGAELGAEAVSLRRLLTASDILTLHVPLTPKTRHLIGRTELLSMKKTAILINTSRGPVVDEQALANALAGRVIFGAGIDVFEFEPKISARLLKLPNLVVTPHIASATAEARDQMAVLAAKNIISVLEGRLPLDPVQS